MAKTNPDDKKKDSKTSPRSPPESPKSAKPSSPKPKKGKKGKGKKGKGKKSNPNKKMTLLFFVNGRADTKPFRESKVKKNNLNEIMKTNTHGEWEYRNRFICNLDGSLVTDPQSQITKTMAFVMVPRSENFRKGYYHRKFIDYMTDLKNSRRTTCW